MDFSIIIPVYNVEQYLPQCLESVLKQSYSSKEILLINDGSTDNSGLICDEYANKYKSVYVIHKKNEGVSIARNCGIRISQGKYIIFVDADDYWKSPDILVNLKKEIEKNNEPDLIFIPNEFHEVNNKLKQTDRHFSVSEFDSLNGYSTLEYLLTKSRENLFSVWRGVFKKELIIKHSIFFEKGVTVGEDADWLFKFTMVSNRTIFFDTAFYVYRINRVGSAMSTKSEKALSSFLYIVEKWIKNFQSNPTKIGKVICIKLSNNYVENYKYIYDHKKDFRESLINKIENINLLDFVDSNEGIKLKKQIKKYGYEKTLQKLNFRWRIIRKIKYFLKKITQFKN